MPTTSNFGWTTPADTDLVKDGAAAIRTLGNGVDTSFVDLKGGTTGQVLSKASNTDLDFTWVAQDDSNAIQNALLTTTGDTIYASGASTPARLAIGSAGQVLTVSGGIPSWATPTSAADNFQLINTGGTALTGAATVTVSGISGKNALMIFLSNGSSTIANPDITLRFNSDSGSNYDYIIHFNSSSGSSTGSAQATGDSGTMLGTIGTAATNYLTAMIQVDGCNATGLKRFTFESNVNGSGNQARIGNGYYKGTSTISSVSVITSLGNWDAGTIFVYGA